MRLEWNSLGLPFTHFMGKFKLGQYRSQLLCIAFTLSYIRYRHPNNRVPTTTHVYTESFCEGVSTGIQDKSE